MDASYRFLKHTADAGVEVVSPTLKGLYEIAGQALFLLIAPESSTPQKLRRIESAGDDPEALLVNFLNDLLLVFELERLLFRKIEIRDLTPDSLCAETVCEELDARGEKVDTVVKAVTWHDLKISQEKGCWRGVFYLDL